MCNIQSSVDRITYGQFREMHYLDWSVWETVRMWCSGGVGLKGVVAQLHLYTIWYIWGSETYEVYRGEENWLSQCKHSLSITAEAKLAEDVNYVDLRIQNLKRRKEFP